MKQLKLEERREGRQVYRSLHSRRGELPIPLVYYQHAKSLQRTSRDGTFGKRIEQAGRILHRLRSDARPHTVNQLLDSYEAAYGDGESLRTRGVIERALALLEDWGYVERVGTEYHLRTPFFASLSSNQTDRLSLQLAIAAAKSAVSVPSLLALSALRLVASYPLYFEDVFAPVHSLLYEEHVLQTEDAIRRRRQITVTFANGTPISLSPSSIHTDLEDGRRTLIGWSEARIVAVRFDRIISISVLDEEAKSRPLPPAWRIPTTQDITEVVITFSVASLTMRHREAIRARVIDGTSHIPAAFETGTDTWRLVLRVCDPYAMLPWIRSFGSIARIEAPVRLQQKMKQQLLQAVARYEEGYDAATPREDA